MWWECLPTLAIMGVCFTGIPLWVYGCNRVFLNNPYKRDVLTYADGHHYLRDTRISGDPYKQVGLESISCLEGE